MHTGGALSSRAYVFSPNLPVACGHLHSLRHRSIFVVNCSRHGSCVGNLSVLPCCATCRSLHLLILLLILILRLAYHV